MVAEVTRSLFDTARQYRESFDVTGSQKSFEWQQVEGEDPVIHTKRRCRRAEIPKRVKVPDYAGRLPEPIRKFTRRDPRRRRTCRSCRAAATAAATRTWSTTSCRPCLGKQPAFPDAPTVANWTMVGICADQSAR